MDLGNLKSAPGSTRKNKRLGRGEASGTGVTAGRGNKGQRSRSGSKRRAWFEGGQMPLQRRLPKFGFYHHGKIVYQVVNLSDLEKVKYETEITPGVLKSAGLVKYADRPIKLLGKGKIEKKVDVKIHAISKTAREQVEKLGGTVTVL
ncbi:50S ribosomal protein L15 [candidate division KSB1 bacterium 4484_188]|nr:MAG: 50S ribosomal protein L15 [candidate division KSB1 bacterium 4484_188]HFE63358.1 50S ribosomal protein L15 [Caldithrix sp.]